MGFEQLADLKRQLAEARKAEAPDASPADQGTPEQGRAKSQPARSGQARPGQARSGQGKPAQPRSGQARVDRAGADQVGARPDHPDQARRNEARAPAKPVDPVIQAIGRLQQLYPKIFPRSPAAKIPLKIGIHKDLAEQADKLKLEPEILLKAIGTWCRGARYWASVQEGAVRVDLAGNEAGLVSANEAKVARGQEFRSRHKPKAKPVADATPAPAAAPGTAASDAEAPDTEAPGQDA